MTHPTPNHEGHVIIFDEPHLNWSVEHPLECREGPVPMSQCPTSEFMRHFYEAPVGSPGRYEVATDARTQMYVLVPSNRTRPRSLIDRLSKFIEMGGRVDLRHDADGFTIHSPTSDALGCDREFTYALRAFLDEAGVA